MPINIVVPELSESVVEATVAEWLKNEGDEVSEGEAVVVLETDKVSVEVVAEGDGVLAKIEQGEGVDVTAGQVLGIIDGQASASPSKSEPAEASASVDKNTVSASPASESGVTATPVAQRMAQANDVKISEVAPSGDKVTKADVEKHVNNRQATSQSVKQSVSTSSGSTSSANGNQRPEERVRLSRRRQTIARRLVEAQSTAAMLTTFNEIDMQAVMDMRSRRKEDFKERHGVSLGFSSYFVKATVSALKVFPRLNAELADKEMILKKYYDIGIAIGAEEGLVVPVLRDSDKLTFAEIEGQIREYAKQSREGTLSIESLMGGTFTITNGGVFGSMMSTPILNPPQVGILGLHGIKERAVIIDGDVAVRPMMYVALTYDHRIVDGREAVQFLVKIKDLIEDPELLLIEG